MSYYVEENAPNYKFNEDVYCDEILEYIGHNFKTYSIKLSDQVYLINFYNSFGFKEIGKVYLEDGIEHINMIKK